MVQLELTRRYQWLYGTYTYDLIDFYMFGNMFCQDYVGREVAIRQLTVENVLE